MMRYRPSYQAPSSSNRLHWILHVLCIGIICFLLFRSGGVSGIDSSTFQNLVESQIRSEMELATSTANTLSRLGATTTSPTLGKIRQYVHGIEIANQFSVSVYGEVGRLIQADMFSQVYAAIDAYDTKLVSGSSVSDVLTALTDILGELEVVVREI